MGIRSARGLRRGRGLGWERDLRFDDRVGGVQPALQFPDVCEYSAPFAAWHTMYRKVTLPLPSADSPRIAV
jgi:hypothetical protein